MTAAELRQLSWRFDDEAFNKGNLAVVDVITPDFINHDPLPGQKSDREGIRKYIPAFRQAFPDLHCSNDMIIAEDNIVAHRGEFLGVPATNKTVTIVANDFQRWENGKMIERWSIADTTDLMQKLRLT